MDHMNYTVNEDSEEESALTLLFDTALENGETFCEMFERHGRNVGNFLHRETYIPVRSTTVGEMEQSDILGYQHDVDGLLIEWRTLEGISFEIPYLNIIPKGLVSVRPVYSLLKKHVDLRSFRPKALCVLRRCVGSQLCYSDGWETWVAFIPECDLNNDLSSVDFGLMAVKALTGLRLIFQRSMKEQIGQGTIDITLSKNNLNNLSYVRILPQEQGKVLSLLQSSLDSVDVAVQGMKKMVFSFRFGEKYPHDIVLPIRSYDCVVDVTVHVGLSIRASFSTDDVEAIEMSLFWSRVGLQEIVGRRGTLTTAFSFRECANFQSNIDGRAMDVAGVLRQVCTYPDQLRFVQLYADMPHRRPKVRFHPVSGAVCILDGVLKNRRGLDTDAESYLSEMSSNVEQVTGSRCRIEMVMSLPKNCTLVNPPSLLQMSRVSAMLEKHPLLVPFLHPSFSGILRSVGLSLVNELRYDYATCKGTGNSEAVWNAYQRELALEKLLWGHPFCISSRLFSVNLGPGLEFPSRSETDRMGFLTLSESTVCCTDEFSSPPVCIYSRSEIVQKQITRTFGFMDLVGGCNMVMGRRLVHVLLQELHEFGTVYERFESFLIGLKVRKGNDQCKTVGGASRQQVAKLIGCATKAKYPMVIGHLLQLLKKNGVDAVSVLEAGFRDLELQRFPAVRMSDEQRHVGLCWKWNYGLIVFTDLPEVEKCFETRASLIAPLIVRELENRKLCFGKGLGNVTFPWIRPCLEKLQDVKLSEEQLLIVLTFVSCLARLMDGAFVDYYRLGRLLGDLPKAVTQRDLQSRQIQSKFLLNGFNVYKVWRLHPSIPFKVLHPSKKNASNENTPTNKPGMKATIVAPVDDNDTVLIPSADEEETITDHTAALDTEVRHLPSNARRKWSPAELGIIAYITENHSSLSLRSKYELYQKECMRLGIPDRSLISLKRKLSRVKDREKSDLQTDALCKQ